MYMWISLPSETIVCNTFRVPSFSFKENIVIFPELVKLVLLFSPDDVANDIQNLYKAVPQLNEVFRIIDKIGEGTTTATMRLTSTTKHLLLSQIDQDYCSCVLICTRNIQLSVSGWGTDAGWEDRKVCVETPHPHQPPDAHCCRASVSCCCRVSVGVRDVFVCFTLLLR